MTRAVVEAVEKSEIRCILCKGWSARMSKEKDDIVLPPSIYSIDSIPHDWLFPQIDCAMHHGGAGTTAASLRAGLTTLIKPFFGDQFFWATRVHKLGAGLRVNSLSANDLTEALVKATKDRVMKEKAEQVGEKLRSEDGSFKAVEFIHRFLFTAGKERGAFDDESPMSPTGLASEPLRQRSMTPRLDSPIPSRDNTAVSSP